MALKLRETIKYPDSMGMQDTFAKIYFDSELAEYQVKVTIDGKAVSQATYYTDDLDDARQTAKAMISQARQHGARYTTTLLTRGFFSMKFNWQYALILILEVLLVLAVILLWTSDLLFVIDSL